MKKKKMLMGMFLFLVVFWSMAGCHKSSQHTSANEAADGTETGAETDDNVLYTIGIAVYDENNPEMRMFLNYYKDYLEQGFPVKFYHSSSISSGDDEVEFIHAMKEQGAQGIISFYGLDVQSAVAACEEDEMYYILASGTLSDESFDSVKDNPWFLGTVGPESDAEYQAGILMAEYFSDANHYLIMTGGASLGNFMHASRTQGILDQLQELRGLTYADEAKTSASEDPVAFAESLSAVTTLDTGNPDVNITICPGYMSTEEDIQTLKHVLADGNYDAVLCSFGVIGFLDEILQKEQQQESNIAIGTIDCFSEENFEAIKKTDSFGNPQIDFVEGKYASMVGPAFAIMYNAMSGYPEVNTESGNAVRFRQGFWTSASREEYVELYGYTQGIYENAYDCNDLMKVIKVFHEDANAESLQALTEAFTVEDVKERVLEH